MDGPTTLRNKVGSEQSTNFRWWIHKFRSPPLSEAGDQLLRLREGSVDHCPLPSRKSDTRALRARVKPLTRQHHARLHQLFVELPHFGKELLARENSCL